MPIAAALLQDPNLNSGVQNALRAFIAAFLARTNAYCTYVTALRVALDASSSVPIETGAN